MFVGKRRSNLQENEKKISIIVPAYNVEKYISKCLDSIVEQTYKNIEIIVINDGSRDGTLNILKEYKEKDNRVIIIDKQNAGVSQARNDGLKKATGNYILFVDGDDWINKKTCEVTFNKIIETNADIVMFSYVREYDNKSINKSQLEDNQIFEGQLLKEKVYRRLVGPYTKEELAHPEKLSSFSPIWGKLYKAELFQGHIFRDIKEIGSSGEDTYLNIEIMPKVKSLAYIKEYFYHYRKNNASSITKSVDLTIHKKGILHYQELKNLIQRQNVDNTFYEALDNFFAINIISESITIISQNGDSKVKKEAFKNIFNDDIYISCVKKLNTSSMPIHWKVYFYTIKHKMLFMFYFLAKCMYKLSSKV